MDNTSGLFQLAKSHSPGVRGFRACTPIQFNKTTRGFLLPFKTSARTPRSLPIRFLAPLVVKGPPRLAQEPHIKNIAVHSLPLELDGQTFHRPHGSSRVSTELSPQLTFNVSEP